MGRRTRQPSTENLEDLETHVPAHPSDREIYQIRKVMLEVETQKRKHSIYKRFPEDQKLRHVLKYQDYEGCAQKTQ